MEQIDPALVALHRLGARDRQAELAVTVERGQDRGHPEGRLAGADGSRETFGFGGHEHEVHAPGLTALERGKERVDLVRERGDDCDEHGSRTVGG